MEILIFIALILMIVLFAGCLFVLILIWRAIIGRSVMSARVAATITTFSNKLATYSAGIAKIEGSVKGLNHDIDVLSQTMNGLPGKFRDELEKYAKGSNNKV